MHSAAALLLVAKQRVDKKHAETAVHAAADAHLKPMTVAVMYAFMVGRKALKNDVKNASAAADAVHDALYKSLPPVLLKCLVAGGQSGLDMLPKRLKAAGSQDQPRDERGRWAGGGVLYHGTSSTAAEKIKTEGLKSGIGKGVGMFGGQTNAEHVNLTTDKMLAKVAASLAADANPGSHGVVIEVRIPKTDSSKVKVNPMNSTTYLHQGTIHPDHLTFKEPRSLRSLKPQVKGEPHDTIGPTNIAFNVDSPEAIAWAQEHAGELAVGISDTTEQAIKDAVANALAGDGVDAAYDDILAAVGDEDRAEMIARTEVMDAANEGLAQSWDQAQEEGLLPDNTMKEWIATSEACPECDDVDGEQVALDDDFSVGDDPPLHPNCRCTMGLAFGDEA